MSVERMRLLGDREGEDDGEGVVFVEDRSAKGKNMFYECDVARDVDATREQIKETITFMLIRITKHRRGIMVLVCWGRWRID
jgi:hypothetical protein